MSQNASRAEIAALDVTQRARAGDQEAFRELIEPHRSELRVHCYRILGSLQDAEDALQETLLAAWQGLPGFQGQSSLRSWLYRIATTRSLNLLRFRRRRHQWSPPPLPAALPPASHSRDVQWLEPYPDSLLAGIPDSAPGPEAQLDSREAVSLAFVAALQLLPPRQRAVHILRDVLGYHAHEVADMLGTTDESVNSALKRARATVQAQMPGRQDSDRPLPPRSVDERAFVDRFTAAFQSGDVEGVVALLTADVALAMPPAPLYWQGPGPALQFFTAVWQGSGRRLISTRANGQPAFGMYAPVPESQALHARALLVLTVVGRGISAITAFDGGLLSRFGLPDTV